LFITKKVLPFLNPEMSLKCNFQTLSNSTIEIDKENIDKLIGDCLYFYLMNLLKCVDAILKKIVKKENYSELYVLKRIESSQSINSAERERRFGYISKFNSEYTMKHSHLMMIYML
jgi:hypothetical protein